jgi:tetratricopeptide (TPR) repeat protein
MSSNTVSAPTTASSDVSSPRQRIFQNLQLIWIDAAIDLSNKDCQSTFKQLQNIVNDIHIFTQHDECIDFLTETYDMKAFLIVEGTLGQQILPLIHDIPELAGVYILCSNKSSHQQWAKTWLKVKGIHTEVLPICESLQHVVKQNNQDSIAVSFVALEQGATSQNLDQLEPSFMYTQLFKEILIEMKHTEQSINDFTLFWRHLYINNTVQLNIIDEFKRDYRSQSSIWWYTRVYFLYQTLNGALRTLDADTIIKMGFFICHLHLQIEQLYKQQVARYQGQSFTVYRGQGISTKNFEKLQNTKGGLISFNNFLSTSQAQGVSLGFANGALGETDTVGILFQMLIDPSVSSAPFASIKEVSYFKEEEEILFSMHTVFRIGEIKQIDKNNPLYQAELTLTSDDDPQLRILTERIREEAGGSTGWHRIGALLLKISQIDKAEELYTGLFRQTSNDGDKALYYNQLGYVKAKQDDYEKALWYYEKSLEICQNTLPPNHPLLGTSYNNIGEVYDNMGEYSKALSFYEKSLGICQKTLPPNHPDLATCYNNIGLVYCNIGDYSKALSFYEKAREIYEKTLPSNHPLLANSYNNIGLAYYNMGVYSKALSFHEKSLEILEKTLPPNHPLLGTSYNNIGLVYKNMGEYSKALSFYEKSLEICQNTLPPNHPLLGTSYNNIGEVYANMGEYSKALSFHKKDFEICQKTLPPNHPLLATSYNSIGLAYYNMGDYSKALSFHEKSLEILQKTVPPNHSLLAASHNNIGAVYAKMREYSKALSFYEKTREIFEKILPPNHPDLATFYKNIGEVYYNMGEYSKALSYFEHALDIRQRSLPPNHPHIQDVRKNIEFVKKKL